MASFSHSGILDMSFHVILVLFNKHLLRGNFSPTSSLVVVFLWKVSLGLPSVYSLWFMVLHLCRHWMVSIHHCHSPGSGVESHVMLCSLWLIFLFLKLKSETYCSILRPSWQSGDRLISPRVTVAACRLAVMKLTSITCNKK